MSFHIHICLYVILCHHIHKMIIRSANTRNEPLWVCLCDTTVHAIEEVVVLSVRLKFNSWISLTRFFPTLKPFSFPQTDFVSFFFFFWLSSQFSWAPVRTRHFNSPPTRPSRVLAVRQPIKSKPKTRQTLVRFYLSSNGEIA